MPPVSGPPSAAPWTVPTGPARPSRPALNAWPSAAPPGFGPGFGAGPGPASHDPRQAPPRGGFAMPMRGRPPAARTATRGADRLRLARQAYLAAIVVSACVQLIFFGRADDNLAAVLLCTASSLAGIAYSLRGERFLANPVSALILLFYTTTATACAIIMKTVEWAPLSDRLLEPVRLYAVLAATQVVLLLTDRLYLRTKALQRARHFLANRVLVRMGMMRWPRNSELWILGALGVLSVAMTGTDYESGATFGMAGAGAKFFRAFGFFKYAPFLIPFRDALSGINESKRPMLLGQAAYFIGLVVLSFATNSRSTFADAIPTIGICLLLAIATGRLDLRRVPVSRLVMMAVGAAVAALVLQRVALAMVVVRDYRANMDASMLISTTIEALFNSEWLATAKAKMDVENNIGNYSEVYVDSRFMARFMLTKFHDNILYYLTLFGDDQMHAYKQFMWERFATTLPDPILSKLGLSINKEDFIVSNGDYVVYLADGWGLGGFKTGSMITEVYCVFGVWFPLVIAACALGLFVFYDAFVAIGPGGRLAMSPMIILLIWNLVGTTAAFGLGSETFVSIPSALLRSLPQNVLVYLIATWGIRRSMKILTGR